MYHRHLRHRRAAERGTRSCGCRTGRACRIRRQLANPREDVVIAPRDRVVTILDVACGDCGGGGRQDR